MKDWIISLFLVAHGWAHIWYVVLSRRLVEFEEWMAWTGESWILSGLLGETVRLWIATIGYAGSLLGFIASGVLLYLNKPVWRTTALASALISSATVLLFWDGELSMIKEKGIIGLLINLAILVYITKIM
ncbi:MAG: hypothetical protein NWF07_06235 [Candidatus Bathyarchaeota archaeon]|nr:hypothetical protein [Candidatus Bathyarchaeota archaeon]